MKLIILLLVACFLSFVAADDVWNSESYPNVCAKEIFDVANNQMVFKVCEKFGGFLGAAPRLHPIVEPTTNEYLEDDDLEFLESSWCNRNAQWATYAFVGAAIERPESFMTLVSEWIEDLHEVIAKRERRVYLVTVPRLYNADGAPPNFFYNTHYFVVQVIIPTDDSLPPRFKIFAGFARHYRMIDYLQEWPINADIPATHRLKLNRTTYAVESFSQDLLFEDFLPRLEIMMNDINAHFEWTRLANDIHADLFFADKFKTIIRLSQLGLKKPKLKQEIRYKHKPLIFQSDAVFIPDTGNDMIFSTSNQTTTAIESATEPENPFANFVPPVDKFYVPLQKPTVGAYFLQIRKYQYTDPSCVKNTNYMRRTCYGPKPENYKPALPLKLAKEDYSPYQERDSLPKTVGEDQKS